MKTALFLAALSGFALASVHAESAPSPGRLDPSDWAGIRDAYQAGRHSVRKTPDGRWIARNPGQQWRAEFDGKGFTVVPDHGQWTWGLELTGYAGRTLPAEPAKILHEGGKVTCQRDDLLSEWFVNDTRGLEQGWTLRQRPGRKDPSQPLSLHLSARGGLGPQVDAGGRSVTFQTKDGIRALTYGGLKSWDSEGRILPARFVQEEGGRIRIDLDDRDARYPVTIDPVAQQAYLKAGVAEMNDNFGTSVAISGDTVIVGASGESSNATGVNGSQANNATPNSGAAYIYVRDGNGWTEQAYLKASNTGGSDAFGWSVAISGDTVVVGALWEASSATTVNGDQNDNDTWDAGAAYVFTRSGTSWTQQAYLKAGNAGESDWFGRAVAISGDLVVVGATGEASASAGVDGDGSDNSLPNAGAAYVFARDGSSWTQQAYLKASHPRNLSHFGISVAADGETVVVGATLEDSNATGVDGDASDTSAVSAGAAYVFARNNGIWSQQGYLKASNTEAGKEFGTSVGISGDTIVVGAPGEDSDATGVNGDQASQAAPFSGAAYIFGRSGGTWSQQAYLKASNTGENDAFGRSVGISGNSVIVGAIRETSNATGLNGNQLDNSTPWAGAAYLFNRNGATWTQQAYLKASNTGSLDRFGHSVAISGDTVVVGAIGEGSADGDPANNGAIHAGAAYVFNGIAVVPSPGIMITSAAKNGASYTIDFKAAAGLSGWQIKGSETLDAFPDDLTASTVFSEISPGNYRAVVDLSGRPALRYFMRIER